MLAGLARFADAREAMTTAIDIAPDYALARYQLGFLELTSGHAAAAQATWGPLEQLAPDNPLRIFARGLREMIADRFAEAIALFEQGMAVNQENPVINSDIRLLIERMQAVDLTTAANEPISAAHLLLQQYTDRTKH